jgi:hypothetical protein
VIAIVWLGGLLVMAWLMNTLKGCFIPVDVDTLRLLTYLSKNKIRLTYHWSELWRTLLSLMRFLTTMANEYIERLFHTCRC